jgi:hypothetical protein
LLLCHLWLVVVCCVLLDGYCVSERSESIFLVSCETRKAGFWARLGRLESQKTRSFAGMMERTKTVSGVTSQHARPVSSPGYVSKYLINISSEERIVRCVTGSYVPAVQEYKNNKKVLS